MLYYKKGFLRIAECWFEEGSGCREADIIRYFHQADPRLGCACEPFQTLVINLQQETSTVFANIKRDTRYEIRRAMEKDHFAYHPWRAGERESLARFSAFYERFAKQKRLRKLNVNRLQLLAAAEALYLTEVRDEDGSTLVWHAYCCYHDRTRLLHSASHLRDPGSSKSLLGRANRYLHWQDFLFFRELGVNLYDFGGFYAGTQDLEKTRINQFKSEFGGRVVVNFNCVRGATRRGKLALWLRHKLIA